jgi:hypothetical protein
MPMKQVFEQLGKHMLWLGWINHPLILTENAICRQISLAGSRPQINREGVFDRLHLSKRRPFFSNSWCRSKDTQVDFHPRLGKN